MDDCSWYKSRTYLHFDPPVKKLSAFEYVTDARNVARHSFYPFISYIATARKFGYDENIGVNSLKVKERPISYASHLDSHIYAYYCFLLSGLYELELKRTGLDFAILAFRSLQKSNIHFAFDVFEEISIRGECCALTFDIKGFFDNLDHLILKRAWLNLIGKSSLPSDHFAVFKAITKYSKVDKIDLYKNLGISMHNPQVKDRRLCSSEVFRRSVRDGGLVLKHGDFKGIPQGSPISALLSNIYMLSFDKALAYFLSGLEAPYYRYCDDIIVIADLEHENKIREFIEREILKIGLNIQPKKTEVRRFTLKSGVLCSDKPLQYLGFTFDGVRIHLRSSSISRYYKKLRKRVWTSRKAMERNNKLRNARGEPSTDIFLRTIYKGYSYLGRRNFLSYGYRAARIMSSRSIKKQLKPHWRKLNKLVESARKGY
ncbi:antiviral reverse transcriptase Drt2 [Pseudomonas syringae]|uniref:antiviral reverse transcriptase Drt2 n=1 Tax=Pseudomonas syringae TaxID=317 RepID=UPI003F771B62